MVLLESTETENDPSLDLSLILDILDHSLFLSSGFGSPLRFDQASLDLNIHRSLKIQVPGVLHRWPRYCVVHLVHLTPKRQLNFPICLFDIVNLQYANFSWWLNC